VFERLNTGSVQLTAQELRHGIYHGSLIDLIESLAKEPAWKRVTRIKSDKRMKRSELVLRFIALSEDLDGYFKPLSGFLNKFAEDHQNPTHDRLTEYKSRFLRTLNVVDTLYGDLAFRPFDASFKAQNALNAALFDAQMVAAFRVNPDISDFNMRMRTSLLGATAEVLADPDFKKTIGAGTSSKTSVMRRIDQYTDFLRAHFDGVR
jgi:hypothetical protein